MLLPRLGSVLLVASTALAFKDTSPFLLLSSDPLASSAPLISAQVALTKDVEDALITSLSACDRRQYYIFSQDHVSAKDFEDATAMAKLRQRIAGAGESSVVQIPEVIVMGQLSAGSVATRLWEECNERGKRNHEDYDIVRVELAALPERVEERAQAIRDTDVRMEETIASALEKKHSAVFVYITTPPSADTANVENGKPYEMDDPYPSGLHTDLKRELGAAGKRQSDDSGNMQAGLPLFEQYQFLSPALFMGLGVSIVLLSILYIGLTAIAGLEVSYAAFSKEMGPQAAQKGKQQ